MDAASGLNLTISATALISIPLTIWLVWMIYKTKQKVDRIERFLISRARSQNIKYVPDEVDEQDPSLIEDVKRIASLRERRQAELHEMERREQKSEGH